MLKIIINGNNLTIDKVVEVARNKNVKVTLSEKAIKQIIASRRFIEKCVKNKEIIYGVTTGFGKFQDKHIELKKTKELQENLIRSHSVGVGKPFSEEIVRASILIRINSLAKGYSGVRLNVIKKLIEFLNKGVYPYVPEQGSVGASGDLAPLAHIALALMGEGEVIHNNKRIKTKKILKKEGIKPLSLSYKEGLALINGTAVMSGIACLNIEDTENLLKTADIAASMSLEVMEGLMNPFNPSVHKIRPHQGQIDTAFNIRKLCKGSKLVYWKKHPSKVQDSYSLRCIPQVHGTHKDALRYIKNCLEIEINSVTDNPLIFPDIKKVISGGNFHGQPISLVMDLLGISISDLGNISERRIAKLLDPHNNAGLPAFLVSTGREGLDSGFMILQYTAAALLAENKVSAHPVSVDSIPTSANNEDHVSFGTIAARKARNIIKNTKSIIAIELLSTSQACDFRDPEKLGQGTKIAYTLIRNKVSMARKDRTFYVDLEKLNKLIRKGALVTEIEKKIGKLR